jgi:hypothetical protein
MTATSSSINSSRANDRKGFGTNSDAQRQEVTCHGRERDGARGLARYDCEKRIRSTHMNKLKYYYYCLLDAVSGGRVYHSRRMSRLGIPPVPAWNGSSTSRTSVPVEGNVARSQMQESAAAE